MFKADRALTWSGYRDSADRTVANTPLSIDLWEAGANPDDLLVGVSVVASQKLLMNLVHTAHPDRRDESSIARGLVIATYPTPSDPVR